MASAWYPKGLEGFLGGDVDVDVDTLRVYLIDSADYTYSAAHDFLDDVPSGARVAFAALTSVTKTNGALDSADPTLTGVTGDQSEALIICKWTGADATSRLLLYIDSFTSGMPVTPNGGNIVITVPGAGWGTL